MSRGDSSARSRWRERSVRANVGGMDAPARARGLVGSPVAEVEGAREDGSASGVGGTSEFCGVDVAPAIAITPPRAWVRESDRGGGEWRR